MKIRIVDPQRVLRPDHSRLEIGSGVEVTLVWPPAHEKHAGPDESFDLTLRLSESSELTEGVAAAGELHLKLRQMP